MTPNQAKTHDFTTLDRLYRDPILRPGGKTQAGLFARLSALITE